jgi:hypothetical protein
VESLEDELDEVFSDGHGGFPASLNLPAECPVTENVRVLPSVLRTWRYAILKVSTDPFRISYKDQAEMVPPVPEMNMKARVEQVPFVRGLHSDLESLTISFLVRQVLKLYSNPLEICGFDLRQVNCCQYGGG